MAEAKNTQVQAAKSYPALLWHDITTRKSEFFLGLFLSVVTGILTVYLQYKDGMLESSHFWDGVMTAAGPVLGIIVIFALVEVYRAASSLNREAQSTIKELEATAHNGDASGRDEFVVLAGQLGQFLGARRADYDSQFDRDLLETVADDFSDSIDSTISGRAGKRARKRAAMQRSHNDFTLQLYGDRFASRVIAASRRLSELGLHNATTAHLGKYPTTTTDIEAIVGELEAASTALPSVRAPETAEEKYWREKSDSEAGERLNKFIEGLRPDDSKPNPYLVVEYASGWHGYVMDNDADEEEHFELEEFLKFTNTSDEVIRRIQVEPFTVWGAEISTELVPTLIPHGEPAQKRVRGVEDQLKKANIGRRAFHKKPVGVPLIVTYYGQSDRQCVGRHALVYDKGNIRVEPLIDGAQVGWEDATEVVAAQEEADA